MESLSPSSIQPDASVPRQEFGGMLWRLSGLIRASERRRSFRAKAFRRALWSLDELSPSLGEPVDELLAVDGIGKGIAALIEQYREFGQLQELEELASRYPTDADKLAALPRMTPRMLQMMKSELRIENVEDMGRAIETDALLTLSGVGSATVELWAKIIELPPKPEAMPAHRAWVLTTDMARHFERHLQGPVLISGAVRRVEEWVDRADLVLGNDQPNEHALSFLGSTAIAKSTEWVAPTEAVIRTHFGLPIHFHIADASSKGTRLMVTTGPPSHVGAVVGTEPWPQVSDEKEVYERSGLAYIPPAARGLPLSLAADVVTTTDLKGDLHLHSEWSPDGRIDLRTLFEAAVVRGYGYILITDHTLGLRFGGLGPDELEKQAGEIARLRPDYPQLQIFHGAEVNIDRAGELDLDQATLSRLDLVVAGIHSHFQLPPDEQTERILRALAIEKVGILAHPTGRRIGIRPAIEFDIADVVEAARVHNVALEVNGHRDRLDLSTDSIGYALENGARLAANSDAHRKSELANVENSIARMQAAGVAAASVINTMGVTEFGDWVESHK